MSCNSDHCRTETIDVAGSRGHVTDACNAFHLHSGLLQHTTMAHNCIDWTATPPTRKIPLLILTRDDDRVYTIVPKDLKASFDPYDSENITSTTA
jgi:hypothetical protein